MSFRIFHKRLPIANAADCKSSSAVTAFEARYLTNFESAELDTSSLAMDISNPSKYESSYPAASCTIASEAKAYRLTRHIPMASRGRNGLFFTDVSLSAPGRSQQDLLRYRLGLFQIRRRCRCGAIFVRGHENCRLLNIPALLSKAEKGLRRMILSYRDDSKLTDIDWLLNTRKIDRAIVADRSYPEVLNFEFGVLLSINLLDQEWAIGSAR